MKISVVVCTYNRCESLGDTLRALQQQKLSDDVKMQVIVIDNNSSDRTPEVVLEAGRLRRPRLHYVFEPQQGLSHARNRGIRESSGDLIAFTDDDAIPEPTWVQALAEGAIRHQADVLGGRILPLWAEGPPAWCSTPRLREKTYGALALLDHGPEPIEIPAGSGLHLFGANFAVRASCFNEVGDFRVDLGRKGNDLTSCEEAELMARCLAAGKRVAYVPDAVVQHKVPRERTQLRYLRRWQFHYARSRALAALAPSRSTPRWLVRECVGNGVGAMWAYARGRREDALAQDIRFWIQLGQIAGHMKARTNG